MFVPVANLFLPVGFVVAERVLYISSLGPLPSTEIYIYNICIYMCEHFYVYIHIYRYMDTCIFIHIVV